MIFKLEFPDKSEYAQAKSWPHLLQEYYREFGEDFLDILSAEVVDEETAKTIMLNFIDEPTEGSASLYNMCIGDDFLIIGSTEWS